MYGDEYQTLYMYGNELNRIPKKQSSGNHITLSYLLGGVPVIGNPPETRLRHDICMLLTTWIWVNDLRYIGGNYQSNSPVQMGGGGNLISLNNITLCHYPI